MTCHSYFLAGTYGGFVDRSGALWSADGAYGERLEYILGSVKGCFGLCADETHNPYSYGLAVDLGGFIWVACHQLNVVRRLCRFTLPESDQFGIGDEQYSPKGVAVDPFTNDIWIANSDSNDVTRLPNDNLNEPDVLGEDEGFLGIHPTGIAVDQGGAVWVANRGSDDVIRIDGNSYLRVDLNDVDPDEPGQQQHPDGECDPYNYSDMTALNLMWTVAPTGVWTGVHDSAVEDTVWGTVTWNASTGGPNTWLLVQVRAANTETDLGKARYMTVQSGVPFECAECDDMQKPCYAVVGRYVQLRVQLNAFCHAGTSTDCYEDACTPWPTLQDITVTPSATVEDCNGNGVPDECLWEQFMSTDCNDNDIPDECEVPEGCTEYCTENCDPRDCNCNTIPDECEEDCNGNQVPDDCDIDSGESCDIDGNGVPDECGACCDTPSFTCRNTLAPPDGCTGVNEDFFAGFTCTDCTCGMKACCFGDWCDVRPGCECREQGGFSVVSSIICSPDTCATGACCTGPNDCEEVEQGQCEQGIYVGGADCESEPCLPCARATTMSADPPGGTVDARQPHPPTDSSLGARQGIGSRNSYGGSGPTAGPEKITITLRSGDFPVTGAADYRCWELCETGDEKVDPPIQPNGICSIEETPPGTYKILLRRPIAAGQWTTITYRSYDGEESDVAYVSHPANVNADTVASAIDLLFLIDCLNGWRQPPYGLYSTDIDHTGVFNAADILRVIDLLNGADLFFTWLGTSKPANTTCPGGGEGEGRGGEGDGAGAGGEGFESFTLPSAETALTAAEVNAEFIDGFVRYVATVVLDDEDAIMDFKVIVEALTGYCVENLSTEERKTLADRLQDPSLEFGSVIAAGVVPDIVEGLLK